MTTEVKVKTKEQLKTAVKNGAEVIIVTGDLADKIRHSLKLKKLSKFALAGLAASLATIPATGGLSLAAAAPIAALSGLEIVAIVAVGALGITLVLSILKEYKHVDVNYKDNKGNDIGVKLEK